MKKYYTNVKVILISLVLICIAYAGKSSTTINAGNVGGQTWTTAGSPYYVYGNITVQNSTTLTIQPGVYVYFTGHYKLDIQGRLLANGSSSSRITFTATSSTTGWQGIRFDYTSTANDSSIIKYCNIYYGNANGTGSLEKMGGGIMLYYFSKVRIDNCTFAYNSADYEGGAISCYYFSSPKIYNNIIRNNSAQNGAGIYCYYNSSPDIRNNEIRNNTATYYGGGIDCYYYCYSNISGNIINNNSAGYYGGGIRINYYCSPTIEKNKISNNSAGYSGGGMYLYYSSPDIINNLICNNNSNSSGGGIYMYRYYPNLVGNTIVNNNSTSYGGGIYSSSAYPTIVNCIIWGNNGSSFDQIYPSYIYNVSYSDIQGGYTGTGNMNANPVFTTPTSGPGTSYNGLTADWSLQSSSPCIDSGSNSVINEYPAWDLDGEIRLDGGILDIGAYEYISSIVGCGTINSDTTWSGSVLINCNVTVANGNTLTIAPGTKIKFLGQYSLIIQGRLLSVGTIDSWIEYYAYDTSVGWSGITFENINTANDSSKIEYSIVKQSKHYKGGAIYINNTNKLLIRSSIFTNNYASNGGGAIACEYYAAPKIINNLIVNNTSYYYGGGIFIDWYANPIITNNTIVNNQCQYNGGGLFLWSNTYGTPIIKNNIIWGNISTSYTGQTDNIFPANMPNVSYNDIQGGVYTGAGNNISSDPLFKLPTLGTGHMNYGLNGDWALQETSPCIDVGTPSITGLDLPPVGLKNKVRVFNSTVDMGAYEDKSTLNVTCTNSTISSNTVWDANNVLVSCDVTVNNGKTLTIKPGTKVIFQGSYNFTVNGRLLAEGTPSDSIKFYASNPLTGWKGIKIVQHYSYNNDSSKITYCDITNIKENITSYAYPQLGGGLTLSNYADKVLVSDCRIHHNSVTGSYGHGGGIFVYGCSPIIENNIIEYNSTDRFGGGLYISSYYGYRSVQNNIISNNSASRQGGGVYLSYAEIKFTGNIISNNTSSYTSTSGSGGGLYISGFYNSEIINNIIVNNQGYRGGGVAMGYDTRPNLINNTISNNYAIYDGGGIYCYSNSDPSLKNTILYGNSAGINGNEIFLYDVASDPKIYYSLVQGGVAGFAGTGSGVNYANVYQNNIDANPSFTSPSSGVGTGYDGLTADWSIQSGSSCINTGTPSVSGINYLPSVDLANNPRVYNGRIDIGAYESQTDITACGTISTNTTWDADTIKVTCDISVANGKTLTIMPGTYVEFQGFYKIDVQGRILALGTPTELVTFGIHDTNHFAYMDTAVGGWNRIQFNSTANTNDSSKFTYCLFKYGKAYNSNYWSERSGGAMYIYNYSKILINNCKFSNNRAYYYGGAIFMESSSPNITNSTFTNNSAEGYTYPYGGAIYMDDCFPTLSNNTICNNIARYGGGIYIYGGSSPIIKNTIFHGNIATYYQSGYYNGYSSQIYLYPGCLPDIYNCNVEYGYNRIMGYSYINTYQDNISSDPQFAAPSSGVGALYDGVNANWSIKSTSPCINKGIGITGLFSEDLGGNTRVVADTLDIGSYESQISRKFITTHPSNLVVCENTTATFTVAASVSVSYQWQKDSVNIQGATNATLEINSVSLSDTGDYLCILSTLHGSIYSNEGNLTVHTTPAIDTHPVAAAICLGNSATFSISASGTPPISYQWYNTNGTVSGGSYSTYHINSVSANDASTYHCIATNNCGFAATNGAALTVNNKPTVTSIPTNTTVCSGSNVSFTTSALGTAPITYQWYKNNSPITSETGVSYTITSVDVNDAANYYCKATNLCGSEITNTALLNVNSAPSIISQTSSSTMCEGQSMTFSVTANGTTPISYQWYKNSVLITGATNNTYTINSISSSHAATYYCIATNTCGSDQSVNIVLTVNQSPEFTAQSSNSTRCVGQSLTLSVTATGTNPITYQWYDASGSIGGATNNTYTINSVATSHAGNYYCIATNTCGNVQGNNIALTVNQSPNINYQTPNTSVCENQGMIFNVSSSGTSPISYQWYYNSGQISGATSNTYTINSISTTDAGSYYCIATNTCGNDQSTTTTLTVKTAPDITSQTSSSTRCSGQSMTFTITASGTAPITYQWYNDVGAISGATNNSYTINSVSSSHARPYYCIATNSCGSDQSSNIILTVNEAPSITYQTPNTTLCEGQSMTFSVSTTGTAPITYQWHNNSGAISGATNNIYTINSLSTTNSGNYYCIATNTCGNDQSTNTTLTINQAPGIASQSSNSTKCVGQGVTFSITATGTNPIMYQWYDNNGSITNATNNTYTIGSVSTSDAGNYYCIATNSCGNIQSTVKTLTINSAPSIISQTSNTTRCIGQSMSFNVSTSGTSPITYQWYRNSIPLSGATSYIYSINSIDTSDAGTYYCIATNSCGNDQSSSITFTVNDAPSITAQSSNVTSCVGQSQTFSITASGTAPITYQWYGNSGSIANATNNTYTINSVATTDAGNYYCVATNSCGIAQSTSKTLTINTSPTIVSQTSNTTRCVSQGMTFTVTATGTSPITYQWYDNSGVIAGATNNIFSINSLLVSDAGSYYCIVTNSCGTDQSNSIVLTVNEPPLITSQSQNSSVCEGQSVTFSITATGTSPRSYQWYHNNAVLANSTNNTFTINSSLLSDAGNYYCSVSNSCGISQSSNIALSINTAPLVTTHSDSSTLCDGQNMILNVTSTGTTPLSYQWYFNNVAITGGANNFYVISSLSQSYGGNYHCIASNMCGNNQSNNINLVVNNPILIISQSGDSSKCVNESMTFDLIATGTSPISYQWYYYTTPILNATDRSYTIDSVSSQDAAKYLCIVTNSCGSVLATSKTLTVNANPVVTLGNDTTFCKGGSVTLSAGSGYFCKWNNGSNNPQLVVDESGNYFVHVSDINGCQGYSDTTEVTVLQPYSYEEICVVTIDPPTGKNLIAWERTSGQNTVGYNVYKESILGGVYNLLGTRPYDSISVWVDNTSNPKQKADRYRITAIDTCGNESEPSQIHKTIHLTANKGTSGENNLTWSDYEGFAFSSYLIYRGTTPSNMSIIDTIQNTLNSYTDTATFSGVVFYQVSAQKLDTCFPTIIRGVTSSGPYSQSLSNLRDYSSSPGNYLTIDPSSITLDSNAGSADTVGVFTNTQYWSVSTDDKWLDLVPNINEGTLTITAKTENTASENRSGLVLVSCDGTDDQVIIVNQVGKWGNVGITESYFDNHLLIYPNPFKQTTNIILPANENQIRAIEVYDISGKLVKSIENINGNKYELTSENMSGGIYFIRAIADRTYFDKIIVE